MKENRRKLLFLSCIGLCPQLLLKSAIMLRLRKFWTFDPLRSIFGLVFPHSCSFNKLEGRQGGGQETATPSDCCFQLVWRTWGQVWCANKNLVTNCFTACVCYMLVLLFLYSWQHGERWMLTLNQTISLFVGTHLSLKISKTTNTLQFPYHLFLFSQISCSRQFLPILTIEHIWPELRIKVKRINFSW